MATIISFPTRHQIDTASETDLLKAQELEADLIKVAQGVLDLLVQARKTHEACLTYLKEIAAQ